MNTIKQVKHLNDNLLGQHGTIQIERSGVSVDGTFTWRAIINVNNRQCTGWGTSEEEARENVVQMYKNGIFDYEHNIRTDNSNLTKSIQVGENIWWKIEQKPLLNGNLIQKDDKKKTITVEINLPEPTKHILLLKEIFHFANDKMEDGLKVNETQLEEFVKRVFPILSYSNISYDQISTQDLNLFYGINHNEELN